MSEQCSHKQIRDTPICEGCGVHAQDIINMQAERIKELEWHKSDSVQVLLAWDAVFDLVPTTPKHLGRRKSDIVAERIKALEAVAEKAAALYPRLNLVCDEEIELEEALQSAGYNGEGE